MNTELTKLSVSDADSGENGRVTWRIVNQEANMPFRLSVDSASLSVVSALDRETTPQYSVSTLNELFIESLQRAQLDN